MLETILPSVDL